MRLDEVQATESKFEEYVQLEVELIRYHIPYAEDLGLNDEMAKRYNREDVLKEHLEKNSKIYLLKEDDVTVGILEYYVEDSEFHENKECLYISELYIKKEYQGKNYGKQVLDYLKTFNKPIELSCYYLLDSHEFYKHLGFKPIYTRYIYETKN